MVPQSTLARIWRGAEEGGEFGPGESTDHLSATLPAQDRLPTFLGSGPLPHNDVTPTSVLVITFPPFDSDLPSSLL